jgi:hypothetical protein
MDSLEVFSHTSKIKTNTFSHTWRLIYISPTNLKTDLVRLGLIIYIIIHSLHDVHEMNTYRADHVCLPVLST